MPGSAQPENRPPAANNENSGAGPDWPASAEATGDLPRRGRALGQTELESALQLLVERAQYITGATGTALALPQGQEMVCRASAGSSAPAVGARLQVRSGLTGESIARRQLLRCDNAETDPRVNLEACRALGIASIVVLPLMRRSGEVRGLFELFSDHPYAFEERDLIALERMADLTLTALDLAEQHQHSAPLPTRTPEPAKHLEPPVAGGMPQPPEPSVNIPLTNSASHSVPISVRPEVVAPPVPPAEPPTILLSSSVAEPLSTPAPALVPEAMLRVQKCASCGFPVSEGRTLCLDCEKKDREKRDFEKKQRDQQEKIKLQAEAQVAAQLEAQKALSPERSSERSPEQMAEQKTNSSESAPDASPETAANSTEQAQEEFVPAFLASSLPVQESWLANHVNLLAFLVLILGILVAVVVFR
ncbi:MAG: GAF domain-containing protein [Terriglobales bacterium]